MSTHGQSERPQPVSRGKLGARPFAGRNRVETSASDVTARVSASPFSTPRQRTPAREDNLDVVRAALDAEFAHFNPAPLESLAADMLEDVARRIRKGEIVVRVAAGWTDAAMLAAVLTALLGEAPQAL